MPTVTPTTPRQKFPWTVEFEGLKPALVQQVTMDKNENWAYDWLKSVNNPEDGTMGVPSEYKRNGYIIFHAPCSPNCPSASQQTKSKNSCRIKLILKC